MKKIRGPFELQANPLPADDIAQRIGAMRMAFHKTFTGSLTATSDVAMMGLMDQKLNSGGYVALERVNGALDGRTGSFALQHSCAMTRGQPQQTITVIPDSGTDQLQGLRGTMTIEIIGDDHFYNFEYEL